MDQVKDVFQRVWPYVLVGVGIGAIIHNWIPEDIVTASLGKDKWWSVIIGINCSTSVVIRLFIKNRFILSDKSIFCIVMAA